MASMVLRNKLSEYIDASDLSSNNDSLGTEENLSYSLNMPSNFNTGVTKTLGEAAHQFIVATAIADWFAITAKGETTDYTMVAEESLKVLEECLCKRSRPTRGE